MSIFITFEGGEGSGKSTALRLINERLIQSGAQTVLTREPGGTPISEEIRNIILDRKNTDMDPRTEALLYAASRRQHLAQKIWPALKEGKIVLCDRYLDSSLAYQGGARCIALKDVLDINMFATEGTFPDLTLLFDIEPEQGLARIAANQNREVNRLDLEKLDFHHRVRQAFLDLAKKYADRYVIIDASQPLNKVVDDAYAAIQERLK